MLNELAKEIHENAVAHGWWEPEPSFTEIIALCHSELSEALEEYRDGMPMIYHRCKELLGSDYKKEEIADGSDADCGPCEECIDRVDKPEGVAVELVDCVIRILDYFEHDGKSPDDVMATRPSAKRKLSLPELIANCHKEISGAFIDQYGARYYLATCIRLIMYWCTENSVDFDEVIRLKMEYNKGRPYKHGGKLI